ncbi:MAG TPA: sulfurtransferase [Mycobacteriales bacterium]|jgi:thiosulfate/3-mercaptopyruvate sulfurtransferase|nr:sulfurtransferase [Mycobacteriales bacterium]
MIPPFVDEAWLSEHPDAVLADVRWYSDDREPGAEYAVGHIPGAVYVDLERWLAGPAADAEGRHPLPDPEVFAEGMRRAGIGDADTVVAYDDAGGVIAARLVWLLRALGQPAALLDGGLRTWRGPVARGEHHRPPSTFAARPWPTDRLADVDEVARLADGEAAELLLDARPAERYAGAPDGLDSRFGHIPGARSLPCRENLTTDGRLLPVRELRDRFAAAGVTQEGPTVVSSCGSGVTACHTLLVLEHLGYPAGRLYPGSWSQWSGSDRPAVTGSAPR